MHTIIAKFGGSSMADGRSFEQVRKIAASRQERRYIILSAPGRRFSGDEKITDLLCRAHMRLQKGQSAKRELDSVRERFAEIIRTLNLPFDPDRLTRDLESDARVSMDRAASRGEALCAKLFAASMDLPFADAAGLIHFDANGRLLRGQTAASIQSMTRRLPRAVIPGFYGTLPDGAIKTFSRGGSDITGALVAAALDADLYENWTDVDGLMSADPALCPEAVCHPAISYRQMRMVARAGAQVLHPYGLEPVCEAGVPTVLLNTFAPEKNGTYISDHVRGSVPCVCAMCGLSALETGELDRQTRDVLRGLTVERFAGLQGREWIVLHDVSEYGRPACLLTAFGMTEASHEAALGHLSLIASCYQDGVGKYLVPPEGKREALCSLHRLLLAE